MQHLNDIFDAMPIIDKASFECAHYLEYVKSRSNITGILIPALSSSSSHFAKNNQVYCSINDKFFAQFTNSKMFNLIPYTTHTKYIKIIGALRFDYTFKITPVKWSCIINVVREPSGDVQLNIKFNCSDDTFKVYVAACIKSFLLSVKHKKPHLLFSDIKYVKTNFEYIINP
jgi:hypothetical protein